MELLDNVRNARILLELKRVYSAQVKVYAYIILHDLQTMNKVVTELIDNSINGLRHTQKLLTGVYEKYSSVYPNDELSLDRYFRAITNYLLNTVEKSSS